MLTLPWNETSPRLFTVGVEVTAKTARAKSFLSCCLPEAVEAWQPSFIHQTRVVMMGLDWIGEEKPFHRAQRKISWGWYIYIFNTHIYIWIGKFKKWHKWLLPSVLWPFCYTNLTGRAFCVCVCWCALVCVCLLVWSDQVKLVVTALKSSVIMHPLFPGPRSCCCVCLGSHQRLRTDAEPRGVPCPNVTQCVCFSERMCF